MAPAGLDLDEAAMAAFADCALGGGLPAEVAELIAGAGLLRHRPQDALPMLERARALAPTHPGPVIALYRFHFYGHALEEARAAGEDALAIARTALGPAFGDVPPSEDATRHDAAVRFYLFTLKGLAYLSLRLHDLPEARRMLAELRRLDPQDRVGGALLQHVLDRHLALQADDPEAADLLPAHPARGWAPAEG